MIESSNGRLRDEYSHGEIFFDLADVRKKLEDWRHDCNQKRPHSALDWADQKHDWALEVPGHSKRERGRWWKLTKLSMGGGAIA